MPGNLAVTNLPGRSQWPPSFSLRWHLLVFETGTFGHEDYFNDLRVRKTRDETKYLKAGNEAYNFPDQTDIVIYLESVECVQDKASSKHKDVSPEAIDSVDTNRPFSHAHKSWKAAISVESLAQIGSPLSACSSQESSRFEVGSLLFKSWRFAPDANDQLLQWAPFYIEAPYML